MLKTLKKWWRDLTCSHVFDPPEMQDRDQSGLVRWPCMKCRHLFVAECGIDILGNGRCTGRWGGKEPLYNSPEKQENGR